MRYRRGSGCSRWGICNRGVRPALSVCEACSRPFVRLQCPRRIPFAAPWLDRESDLGVIWLPSTDRARQEIDRKSEGWQYVADLLNVGRSTLYRDLVLWKNIPKALLPCSNPSCRGWYLKRWTRLPSLTMDTEIPTISTVERKTGLARRACTTGSWLTVESRKTRNAFPFLRSATPSTNFELPRAHSGSVPKRPHSQVGAMQFCSSRADIRSTACCCLFGSGRFQAHQRGQSDEPSCDCAIACRSSMSLCSSSCVVPVPLSLVEM